MTASRAGAAAQADPPDRPAPETPAIPASAIETICKWLAMTCLAALLVIVATEVTSRNLLNLSWDGSDEFGGYLLVAVTFLSMPVCLARGGFHEMQIVRVRLSARGVAGLNLAMHALSLLFTLVLVWQFGRLELTTWKTGDVSMTSVMTPLWIPRLVMVVGSLVLCVTLLRLMASEWRRMRQPPEPAATGLSTRDA